MATREQDILRRVDEEIGGGAARSLLSEPYPRLQLGEAPSLTEQVDAGGGEQQRERVLLDRVTSLTTSHEQPSGEGGITAPPAAANIMPRAVSLESAAPTLAPPRPATSGDLFRDTAPLRVSPWDVQPPAQSHPFLRPAGMVEPGNIDLQNRPVVHNPDGSVSTVYSSSREENGQEVLVPGVSADGRKMEPDEAWAEYQRTGQHLGKFASVQDANAWADKLHSEHWTYHRRPDGTEYASYEGGPGSNVPPAPGEQPLAAEQVRPPVERAPTIAPPVVPESPVERVIAAPGNSGLDTITPAGAAAITDARHPVGPSAGDMLAQAGRSAAKGFVSGVGSVVQAPSVAASASEHALAALGAMPKEGITPAHERAAYQYGQAIKDEAASLMPDDPALKDDFLVSRVPEMVGGMLPYLPLEGVASLLGPAFEGMGISAKAAPLAARAAAVTAPLLASAAVGGYQQALARGEPEEKALESSGLHAIPALAYTIPMTRLLGRVAPEALGPFASRLAEIGGARGAGRVAGAVVGQGLEGAVDFAVGATLAKAGDEGVAKILGESDPTLAQGVKDAAKEGGAGAVAGFLTSFLMGALGAPQLAKQVGVRGLPARVGDIRGPIEGTVSGGQVQYRPRADPYGVLGVSQFASNEEINRVFRDRAAPLHPDRAGDDPLAAQAYRNLTEARQAIKEERTTEVPLGDLVARVRSYTQPAEPPAGAPEEPAGAPPPAAAVAAAQPAPMPAPMNTPEERAQIEVARELQRVRRAGQAMPDGDTIGEMYRRALDVEQRSRAPRENDLMAKVEEQIQAERNEVAQQPVVSNQPVPAPPVAVSAAAAASSPEVIKTPAAVPAPDNVAQPVAANVGEGSAPGIPSQRSGGIENGGASEVPARQPHDAAVDRGLRAEGGWERTGLPASDQAGNANPEHDAGDVGVARGQDVLGGNAERIAPAGVREPGGVGAVRTGKDVLPRLHAGGLSEGANGDSAGKVGSSEAPPRTDIDRAFQRAIDDADNAIDSVGRNRLTDQGFIRPGETTEALIQRMAQGKKAADLKRKNLWPGMFRDEAVGERLTGAVRDYVAASRMEGASTPRPEPAPSGPIRPEPEATGETRQEPGSSGEPQPRQGRRRVVSDDEYADVLKQLRAKLNELRTGVDPDMWRLGTKVAMYHLERTPERFMDFAHRMSELLGKSVKELRPYLRKWYNGARDDMEEAGHDVSGMDSPDAVRDAISDIDALPAEEQKSNAQTQPDRGVVPEPASQKPAREPAGRPEAAGGERPAPGLPEAGGGAGEEPVRHDGGKGAGAAPAAVEPGAGAGHGERVGAARPRAGAGRGNAEGAAGRVQLTDFRIGSEADVGAAGREKTAARENMDALKALKAVEAEDRPATREEQAVLAKYVGWGGLSAVFDRGHQDFERFGGPELKGLLTDDEYREARESTTNAHYTSVPVIRQVHAALAHLGIGKIDAPRVLEPSAGIGHFLGLTPEGAGFRWTAVEKDLVTGRIASLLYPKQNVQVAPFEKTMMPDDYFDVAVGNVPFGQYPVVDSRYPKFLTGAIHNYFFARALDKVRPGGVVAFITSRYTLDAQADRVRRALAEKADMVGAVRLPNTAFGKNANTKVVTDLIILRKRAVGEPQGDTSWLETAPDPQTGVAVNRYFIDHPDMILGKPALVRGMHVTNEYSVNPAPGELEDQIKAAVAKLPPAIIKDRPAPQGTVNTDPADALPEMKEGGFTVANGKIMVRHMGKLMDAAVPSTQVEKVKRLIRLRDATRSLTQAEAHDAPTAELDKLRATANREYDGFVKHFGPINLEKVAANGNVQHPNYTGFRLDPEFPRVASLEVYDSDKGTAEKAPILVERQMFPPRSRIAATAPIEALPFSIADRGKVDLDYIGAMLGQTEEQVKEGLRGSAFEDPETGNWVPRDEYLSGNVRKRLALAKDAAARDGRFNEHVEELEKVQPQDLLPADIHAGLGAPWIPPKDIEQYIRDTFLEGRAARIPVSVAYVPALGLWRVDSPTAEVSTRATTEFGTPRKNAIELIQDALNQKPTIVYDRVDETTRKNPEATIAAQAMQERLRDHFREWVWKDADRSKRLVRKYNDEYNNIRERHFEAPTDAQGNVVWNPPGLAREYALGGERQMHPWQRNGAYRVVASGNTLLAHVVGAGKTVTMVTAGMELKRLGLSNRPLYIVPNHMLEQFGREFLQTYPNANILLASKEDFQQHRRAIFTAKVSTGNWDAVVMTHSMFGRIPSSPEFQSGLLKKEIDSIEDAIAAARSEGAPRNMVKQIETQKKRLEAKLALLAERIASGQDRGLTFEELGIDTLFVDEAHLFKNLVTPTKIAGLPRASADRAFDLYTKTRYLDQINPKRGVIFATGTPIANSMAEAHVMMRYLQQDALEEKAMRHFDAWAAAFGEYSTELAVRPDSSGFKMRTRFAKFANVPELTAMLRQVWDVKRAAKDPAHPGPDEVPLPRPALEGGKPEIVVVPSTPTLRSLVQSLAQRADRIAKGGVNPAEDNMLKITGEGRKAALDLRVLDPGYEPAPDEDNKVSYASKRIFDVWKQSKDQRLTQLVFADLSTPTDKSKPKVAPAPKPETPADEGEAETAEGQMSADELIEDPDAVASDKWNVYQAIKDNLIRMGVPEQEVAFIHDAPTDAKKARLFQDVRSGKVRVLIGSTEKMGVGTNVQKKLVALHHLDAPWRPADVEQRDGRGLRQGNENKTIRILRYVTENSFDAYMWDTLGTKDGFIGQVMSGTAGRTIEDISGNQLNAAEVMALASGNPKIMEKAKVDAEVVKLTALRKAHTNTQYEARQTANWLPEQEQRMRKAIAAGEVDAAVVQDTKGDKFKVVLDGTDYTKRSEAEPKLLELVKGVLANGLPSSRKVIGQFAGFPVRVDLPSSERSQRDRPKLTLVGRTDYSTDMGGILYRMEASGKKVWDTETMSPGGTLQRLENLAGRPVAVLAEEKAGLERNQQRAKEFEDALHRPFKDEEKYQNALVRQRQLNDELDIDKQRAQMADGEGDGEEGGDADLERGGFLVNPFGRKALDPTGPTTAEQAHDLVKGAVRTLAWQRLKARMRAESWRKALSETRLEDIGAAVEGIDNLRTGKTIDEIRADMTPAMQRVLDAYTEDQEAARKELNGYMQESGEREYIQALEDYLPHVYAGNEKTLKGFAVKWAKRAPSAKKRVLPTLQDAVDAGLTPLTQNVATLHELWAEMNWRVAVGQHFVAALKDIRGEVGLPVIRKPDDAPADWPVVDHPAIQRVYAHRTADGTLMLWRGGAAVDPQVHQIIKHLLERPFSGNLVKAISTFNSLAKETALSLSFFHHVSLATAAQGALPKWYNPLRGLLLLEHGLTGGVPLGGGLKLTTPNREGLRLLHEEDVVRDAVMSGLKIDPSPEANASRVDRAFAAIEAKARPAGPLGRGAAIIVHQLARGRAAFNRVLWQRYYTGLKLYAFNDLTRQVLERAPETATPQEIAKAKESVAQAVNNMFGGQEWESKVWATPKARQVVRAMFMAPDWTYSVLSSAAGPLAGDDTQRALYAKYWLAMLVSLGVLTAAANKLLGGRWPWENEPGHKIDVDVTDVMRELPWHDKADKRRWYIRPGKQVREVMNYLTSPVDVIGAKFSPLVRQVLEQFTGHEPGQDGWEMPWVKDKLSWYQSLEPRIAAAAAEFVPFSFRGDNFALTFPLSRGMSWYKAQRAYEDMIRAQVDPSLYNRIMPRRDADQIKFELDHAAEENGLDAGDAYRQARGKVRTDYFGQLWSAISKQDHEGADKAARVLVQLGEDMGGIRESAKTRGLTQEEELAGMHAALEEGASNRPVRPTRPTTRPQRPVRP